MRRGLDDPAPGEIGAKLGRGVAITALSQVVKLLTQMASVVVLSRLLAPADFGLVAMVAPVVGLISLFQDIGLSQALVQRERITAEQVSAVFWINLLIAALLAGLTIAAAPAVARLYREPAVGPLTAAFGATFLLTGASGPSQALLNRQLRFGALAAIDVGAGTAGLAVAIGSALLNASYWALFFSTLAYRTVAAIVSWLATDWRPQWPRLRSDIGDMVRFGGGLTAANVSNFLLRNADNVMIGAYWGPEVLGAYERAYQLLLFPLQQVTWPLSRVMVTTLSRLQSDPARYRDVYLRTLRLMLLFIQPGIVFALATADELIPTVLGAQWEPCVPIFLVLGVTGLQQPLTSSIGWLLISRRRGTVLASWGAYSLLVILPAFAVGLPWGGVGVAAGYAAADLLLRTPVYWYLGSRAGPVSLRDLLDLALPQALGCAAAFAAIAAFRHATAFSPIPDLGACFVIAYGANLLVVLSFPQQRHTAAGALTDAAAMMRRGALS